MRLGVYTDLSNTDYHSDTSAISRSGLMLFRKSPWHYWNAYLDTKLPSREKNTDAAVFGNAFHTLVLEPETFLNRFAVMPEGIDRRTKQGKQEFEDFTAKSVGKSILKADQIMDLHAMQQSVYSHPQAMNLLEGGLYERSIFWQDKHAKVRCKTRPDIWHSNMTVDLKTIADASARSFTNSMIEYGYHLQAAMNREGIQAVTGDDVKNHAFICVEKTYPFSVAVYILGDDVLDYARFTMKNTLLQYKECLEKNLWTGYETKTIFLPNWVK